MKLSQAINYHSSVPLEGREADGSWSSSEIALGSFLTFDKFITDRSFGQKKRLFQCHSGSPIPTAYNIVRCQGDTKPYLIVAVNDDIGGIRNPSKYNSIYLLQEAAYTIEILSETVVPKASGSGGDMVEVVDLTTLADRERVSSRSSEEFSSVTHTTMIFTLPGTATLTTDNRLRVDGGVVYDVLEVWGEMNIMKARASKLSGGA